MEGQQEGSRTSSRAESKNRTPHRPLGLLQFTAFDPGSPKWGRAEAEEGCYQDGWGNKARIQAGGGARGLPQALQGPGLECYSRGGRAPAPA